MTLNPCDLLDLPAEILTEILSNCSVEDVLSVEQTCKRLKLISAARPVWLSLLRKLDIKKAPNIPPQLNVDTIPTPELTRRTKCAVRAYRNWSRPDGARVTREQKLSLSALRASDLSEGLDPRLLPGGERAVVNNCGRLELWAIDPSGCLWQSPAFDGGYDCIPFDTELAEDGRAVTIAGIHIDRVSATPVLRVIRYEEETKEGHLVIERELPVVFVFRLQVKGDLVMAHLPHSYQVILVNWKTGVSQVVDFSESTGQRLNARAALIADQVLLVALNTGVLSVAALPLASIADGWSHATHYSDWTRYTYTYDADTVLPLPHLDASEGPWVLAIQAFTPTWRGVGAPSEIHLVTYGRVEVQNPGKPPQKAKRFMTYRLQLSRVRRTAGAISSASEGSENGLVLDAPDGPWRLVLVDAASAPADTLPWNADLLCNAGRMFAYRENSLMCYDSYSNFPQPKSEANISAYNLRNSEVQPCISAVEPWSGSVAIGSHGLLRILHFD